jgi:protein-L-isoaspartate(D-aspartate) O-methyltransferase
MEGLAASRAFFASLVTANVGISRPDHPLRVAFASTPRERFIGNGPWRVFTPVGYIETPCDDPALLYQDITVALEEQGTINNGQPTLHPLCISALSIEPGEVIVHIGAGSGYYTALLSKMTGATGSVSAYEIESRLADRATRNLEDLKNTTVHSVSGSGTHLPACDVIYVNAGATAPVQNWLDALRIGGRLLFPLTGARNHGAMLLIKRTSWVEFEARFLCRAAFIPCIGARDEKLEQSLSDTFQTKDIACVRSLRSNTPPDESCWFAAPSWWLSTAAAGQEQ